MIYSKSDELASLTKGNESKTECDTLVDALGENIEGRLDKLIEQKLDEKYVKKVDFDNLKRIVDNL